jgi:hypothetical protein
VSEAQPGPEDVKIITLARAARARVAAAEGAAVRDETGRTYAAAAVKLPSLQLSALHLAVAMAGSRGAASLEAAAPAVSRRWPGRPQPALLDQDHRRGGGHRLGHGRDAEDRVPPDRIGVVVRHGPDRVDVHLAAAADQADQAGQRAVRDVTGQDVVQAGNPRA